MNKIWVLYFSVIAGIVLVFLKADDCIDRNRMFPPSTPLRLTDKHLYWLTQSLDQIHMILSHPFNPLCQNFFRVRN